MDKKVWIPYALFAIAIAVIGFMYQRNQNLKIKAQKSAQNEAALDSLLTIEKNKVGDLEVSKASFIATEKELKALNKDLYDEVQAEKGQVLTLGRIVFSLQQDTAMLRAALANKDETPPEPIQVNDSTFKIPWNLKYAYENGNFDNYTGVTEIEIGVGNPYKVRHIFTEMLTRQSQINLTFGQRIENNQLRVFANSDYPGFTPEMLEGVLIDPNKNPFIKKLIKKKHWFTGFGVGVGMTVGYNMLSGSPAINFGPTIHYTIYQW